MVQTGTFLRRFQSNHAKKEVHLVHSCSFFWVARGNELNEHDELDLMRGRGVHY